MPRQSDIPVVDLAWEIQVPLLSNRLVIGATIRIFGFSILLVGGLVSLVLATQSDFKTIPTVLLLVSVTGFLLFLTALLLMAVIFRNRWQYRYTLDDAGIVCETIDRRIKAANRLAVVAGTVLGSSQATGAGLVGKSQEIQTIRWKGRFRAELIPESRTLIFHNAWRKLMIVYCLPENYAQVARICQTKMAQQGTEKRLPERSIIPRYIGYSIAIVVSSIPLLLLAEPFDLPLWIPMVLVSFSLATLWLIAVLGYAVFGLALLVLAFLAGEAFSVTDSALRPGEHYPRWVLFSGDDWASLFLGIVGLLVLCWFARKALNGRIVSVLASDAADMDG
jgi:hypothetical protein